MRPKIKTIDELRSLSSKNLLRYYRSQRSQFHGQGYVCGCCQEFSWDIHSSHESDEEDYNIWQEYLKQIKDILATKEHVERSRNGKLK